MYAKVLSLALLPIIAIQAIGSASLVHATSARTNKATSATYAKKMVAIAFASPSTSISRGATMSVNLVAKYSDKSIANISADPSVTYATSNKRYLNVSGDGKMTAGTDVPANATVTVTATTTSGLTATMSVTIIGKEDLIITPSQVDLKPGETAQIQAKIAYSDGKSYDVTNGGKVTYQSMDTSLATVNASGLITALSGTADTNKGVEIRITAGDLGLVRTVFVRIVNTKKPLIIEDLVITPETMQMGAGESQQLKLEFTKTDGQIIDVTSSPKTTYVSSNPAAVTVSAGGNVTVANNVADDTAVTVTATYMGSMAASAGLSRSVLIKVGVADIRGISVNPKAFSLNSTGATKQLTVETVRADWSIAENVTYVGTSYASSDSNVVTVNSSGLVTVPASASWCGTKNATITIAHGGWTTTSKVGVLLTNGCSRKK